MIVLEHDAKELLAGLGLPVPAGTIVRPGESFAGSVPVVVKAQVPVGGRGKAGGIRVAAGQAEVDAALEAIFALTIKGHRVRACRCEEPVQARDEVYISFTVDAAPGAVRVLLSPHGGVDVEDEETRAGLRSATARADEESLAATVGDLAADMPEHLRGAALDAGTRLARAFLALEAIMLEINPLFVREDGSWAVGDTKLVVDENAFARVPRLQRIVEGNPDLYEETALKLRQEFDFVRLDPDGDIGLVTTGAGLSMQLIDELISRGSRPFNFCDIRTGQFRGDPARLILVLTWLSEAPSIKSVLINFFAGHTDLGEVSRLLIQALAAVPLKVPITARMIGNGVDEARAVLAAADPPIQIEEDLDRAIELAIVRAGQADEAHD